MAPPISEVRSAAQSSSFNNWMPIAFIPKPLEANCRRGAGLPKQAKTRSAPHLPSGLCSLVLDQLERYYYWLTFCKSGFSNNRRWQVIA
jgi:hypothetical protein